MPYYCDADLFNVFVCSVTLVMEIYFLVLVKCHNHNKYILIMMQIYFKSWLVKCRNIMQIYFYKDLLVKCHIIVMQIY